MKGTGRRGECRGSGASVASVDPSPSSFIRHPSSVAHAGRASIDASSACHLRNLCVEHAPPSCQMSHRFLFTSESVTEGHPDKLCDQVSDGVLDAIFAKDPSARVACETFATTGVVLVGG